MPMLENDSATPQNASETSLLAIMFKKLHEGIENGCECDTQDGVVENTTDRFARRVWTLDPGDDDFLSWKEEGKKNTYTKCEDICNYRGVSTSRVDDAGEAKVLAHYRKTVSLSRTARPPFYGSLGIAVKAPNILCHRCAKAS